MIGDAVDAFAAALADGVRVLDAGAGECAYKKKFDRHCYTGVDLGIGDAHWNYSQLDAIADLIALPFRGASFDAALNIVTLEHVREPAVVLAELCRVLVPGGRLLLVVPHEWEEHQVPHDYFRYTRYGARYLLEKAGFTGIEILPVGRVLPASFQAYAQRPSVLSRPAVLPGRDHLRASGPAASRTRCAGSSTKLYTGIYMHRAQALLMLAASLPALAVDFSGASALEFTRKAVAFGPRPPASQANLNQQVWMKAELKKLPKCQVSEDPFTAQTPKGPMPMKNIIAPLSRLIRTCHCDHRTLRHQVVPGPALRWG